MKEATDGHSHLTLPVTGPAMLATFPDHIRAAVLLMGEPEDDVSRGPWETCFITKG